MFYHICVSPYLVEEALLYRARYSRDAAAYEEAKQFSTPSCDRMVRLYG